MERHANLIGVYDAEETIEAKLGSVAAENEKSKSNERPSTCAPPPFFPLATWKLDTGQAHLATSCESSLFSG